MSLDFTNDNPRVVATLALAANTVLSLKAAIIAALTANAKTLFVDYSVADLAARLALSASVGEVAYQVDTTTFYELTTPGPTVDGNWTAITAAQCPALYKFLRNLSWKIGIDSSIGNAGAGTLYYGSKFIETGAVPSSSVVTTYGIAIAANTERSVSGYADQYFVYSAAGTNLVIDLIFETGG